MINKQTLSFDYLPIGLIVLMVMTRFHHFGDFLHLPDASLAVFFFAGFYRTTLYAKVIMGGFLLILAGVVDYLAIANGTSAWCISPAYIFLTLTYAVMWLAGYYCANSEGRNESNLGFIFVLSSLAATLAFVISNGSFFLFSGRYEALSWLDYAVIVKQYFPLYIGSAVFYVLLGLGINTLGRTILPSVMKHRKI